jgi:hypothetical protein
MADAEAGFGFLVEKLSLEAVLGIRPLLPDARYGQDVAMVAFVIDQLRAQVRELRGESIDKLK